MENTIPVPEEIIERILELVCAPSEPSSLPHPDATNVLLVCKTFERIALPFLYTSLVLKSRTQADNLAATLSKKPQLSQCARAIYVDSPALGHAFSLVVDAMQARYRPLDVLDVKLDSARGEDIDNDALLLFNGALRRCPDAKSLVVRKSGYLTHDNTVRAVADLAYGIRMCSSVERVDLKYKPSPLPATLLPATSQSTHPFICDPLASALASLPLLKVIRAQLPAIWNPFLLEVASNAALDRIELVDRDELANDADTIPTCSSFVACEGRIPCRGRGRGMSDVAYVYPSSSKGPASVPPHQHQYHSLRSAPCPCNLGITPEIESAVPEPCDADVALPPSLFMTQATKHTRLHALILAGRRHMFLARMQARAARVRADMVAGNACVCSGSQRMSASYSQTQSELLPLPPSPTTLGFGSRTRAHTVVPSPSGSRRAGRP